MYIQPLERGNSSSVLLFPQLLPKLGNSCMGNMICVPYLCRSRFSIGLSSYDVVTQFGRKMEEGDDFASLARLRIVPCSLLLVPYCLVARGLGSYPVFPYLLESMNPPPRCLSNFSIVVLGLLASPHNSVHNFKSYPWLLV